MKSMKTFVAVAALVALSTNAQAGLFGHLKGCGASKCCDCAPTFQPECCKPTIVRPCHRNVYNYQRSCAKPLGCCDNACDNGCGPVSNGCLNNGGACDNGGNGCVNGNACVNGNGCVNGNACGAPCGNGNGCINGDACGAPCGNGNGCVNGNACDNGNGCHNTCGAPADPGCGAPCDSACCPTVDPCEIAELIYQSQTACYPRQRKAALRKLGNRYDCVCNPEIISAFVYALNDADHRVRAAAADEIGDQVRKNPCCCSQCTVSALTVALADCDRGVRRQAEQALKACGYDIIDGNCDTCCETGCVASCSPVSQPATHSQQPTQSTTGPAPAPPVEGERAYFPKRQAEQTARPASVRKSLNNLFSLAH
ncbi:HEAT repeat domain-containing protein [Planctomicrobium sp. SH664]|uniref:HEAT repeat domain-containing protein n=1 Tax=Planctomicrobium sp. SH664 TaxID=3448125 RepID=UPI003F5BE60A